VGRTSDCQSGEPGCSLWW